MNERQNSAISMTERAKQMSRNPGAHPFRIGGLYANRQGEYEVISITPPTMTVRYHEGGEMVANIVIMARIWENMQLPPEVPEAGPRTRAAAKPASRTRAANTEFRGLTTEDFKLSVSRTTWRTRLGQLLATRLTQITDIPHKSFPVDNRPELYVTRELHFSGKLPQHRVRFLFRLTAEAAEYGLLVERDAQKMDRSWDWLRFIDGLRKPEPWMDKVGAAMLEQGLQVAVESSPMRATEATREPVVVGSWAATADGLETLPMDGSAAAPCTWQDLAGRLDAVELGQFCAFRILGRAEKDEAVALGEGIVERVAQAYASLMPIYDASAR